MVELDVHVLRSRVEVRHAKVLHPTGRLWEKWYLLPRGTLGVPIENVLAELAPQTPLMIDLKCFSARSSRRIMATLPEDTPVVASSRSWWVLQPFRGRSGTRRLRSCGSAWQLWWALRLSRFGPDEGVCVHERRLTPRVLAALRQRTPVVFTWGVTNPARAEELTAGGITGVIVDDYGRFGPAR